MSTAVVLGGGVSGLAAVYYLQRAAATKFGKIILLEGSERLGGWVQSTRFDNGAVFEHGPRSLRPVGVTGLNTLLLAEDLGLSDDILPCLKTSPPAQNRFLFVKGKLHKLPNNLKSVVTRQEPFSKPILLSALKEMLTKKGDNSDESVHSFISRRFGSELADFAVDPMCRGIFAGNCRDLSIDACFPLLTDMENQHGSVIRGMLTPSKRNLPVSPLVTRAKFERWASWSLRTGMQQLTDTMSDVIGQNNRSEVRLSSPCVKMELQSDGKIKVCTESEDIVADQVFSSLYAKNLADLLPSSLLRDGLVKIPAVNVAVVNLEYDTNFIPTEGFGHLLPSFESGPILGVVYDSCTFPQHNRTDIQNTTRLTVMMGGSWFDELSKLTNLDESRIEQLAVETVNKHFHVSASPTRTHVAIQKECIPQYLIGHKKNLTAIEDFITSSKLPLSLIGSSYRGPAINDCIYNAKTAVEKINQS